MITAGRRCRQKVLAQSVGGLKLLTIATGFDADFEGLHPKRLRRITLGPMYSASFTLQSGPISKVLEDAKAPEGQDWALVWTVEDLVADREEEVKDGWFSSRARQVYKLDPLTGADTGTTTLERMIILPERPYQVLVEQDPAGPARDTEIRGGGRGAAYSRRLIRRQGPGRCPGLPEYFGQDGRGLPMSTRDTMELKEEAIRAQYEAALGMLIRVSTMRRGWPSPEVETAVAERSPGVGVRPRFRSTVPGHGSAVHGAARRCAVGRAGGGPGRRAFVAGTGGLPERTAPGVGDCAGDGRDLCRAIRAGRVEAGQP